MGKNLRKNMPICAAVSFCYTEGKKTLGNIVDQLYFNWKNKDKIND